MVDCRCRMQSLDAEPWSCRPEKGLKNRLLRKRGPVGEVLLASGVRSHKSGAPAVHSAVLHGSPSQFVSPSAAQTHPGSSPTPISSSA